MGRGLGEYDSFRIIKLVYDIILLTGENVELQKSVRNTVNYVSPK